VFAFTPIHTANPQAIKAMGRSDIFLKLEIAKKIIGIIILFAVMRWGVIVIAGSGIFTTVVFSVINAGPNKKMLSYTYFEQIKDLLNGIVPLGAMILAVLAAGMLKFSPMMMLSVQILVGMMSYISVSAVTKNESFQYALMMIKRLLKKRGK